MVEGQGAGRPVPRPGASWARPSWQRMHRRRRPSWPCQPWCWQRGGTGDQLPPLRPWPDELPASLDRTLQARQRPDAAMATCGANPAPRPMPNRGIRSTNPDLEEAAIRFASGDLPGRAEAGLRRSLTQPAQDGSARQFEVWLALFDCTAPPVSRIRSTCWLEFAARFGRWRRCGFRMPEPLGMQGPWIRRNARRGTVRAWLERADPADAAVGGRAAGPGAPCRRPGP